MCEVTQGRSVANGAAPSSFNLPESCRVEVVAGGALVEQGLTGHTISKVS